eukprot:TRINITY_DN16016_c2_g3_i1.p1 TRINITY_DN16016_c2_g3~~TRINITY_DN16016_c2_g3_i1.p1  ORF type:complete len:478 (+),score=56.69 TRINITY_DN16016_c2_g3_i1:191-1435(+)
MPAIFKESLELWAMRIMQGPKAVLAHFFFAHCVLVRHSLYREHLHDAEVNGELVPDWIPQMQRILGPSSIIVLPGGRGHTLHKRLRTKILSAMGPKATLEFVPDFLALIRQSLDELCAETQRQGYGQFEPAAQRLASKVSSLPITAGLDAELQARVEQLMDTTMEGMFGGGLPVDLGRFSAFGRGMIARKTLSGVIRHLMDSPNLSRKNIISELKAASEQDAAFTPDEVVDTAFTLLVAGKLTTADALPWLLMCLHDHPDWAAKVAQEPLEFHSIEEDSAALRVVREAMRMRPPAGAYRRSCSKPVDFGEHGRVPAGCPMAILIGMELIEQGDSFDPDRWDARMVREYGNLTFGGAQPHSCIGKSVALIELQLFARVLCREYDFKAINPQMVVKMPPLLPTYKDGLHVAISRKV